MAHWRLNMSRRKQSPLAFTIELGPELKLDGPTLLESKLFICTNSGGGKTHASRLFIESVAKVIPTIVIDPSGEYFTLREKFDFALIGAGGEVPVSVKTAARLAHHLVEKRLNAILDLSSLGRSEQEAYIAEFFRAVNSLPRKLWGPTFFVVDEIHRYAPEKLYPVSRDPLVTLFDSGRLKGFCGVAISQRQAKVAVDVRQECNNILQGRASAPAEVSAASKLVGFKGNEASNDFKNMKIGEFFAIGPAFAHTGIQRGRTFAKTQTTHISSRNRYSVKPPAPSKRIKEVASELSALLQEAAPAASGSSESTVVKQLRARVRELEAAGKQYKTQTTVVIDASQVQAAEARGWSRALQEVRTSLLPSLLSTQRAASDAIGEFAKKIGALKMPAAAKSTVISPRPVKTGVETQRTPTRLASPSNKPTAGISTRSGAYRILVVLAQHYPNIVDRTQLALLAQMGQNGSFDSYLSRLRTSGWLENGAGGYKATDAGVAAAGDFEPLPEGRGLIDYWLGRVGGGGMKRIFEVLIEAGDQELSRAELAERAGLQLSGSFDSYVSRLRGMRLIEGSKTLRLTRPMLEASAA